MTPTGSDGFRLFGVEDGSFDAFNRVESTYALLCGVLTQGDRIIDVRKAEIEVDGLDATEKLLKMLEGVDVDAVVLGGITFAGFNVIDPRIIKEETGLPVIVYSGVEPDNEAMLGALQKHFSDWMKRWEIVKNLGPIHGVSTLKGEPDVFFEAVGCDVGWAEKILRASAVVSRIPEPVRASGLIARGLSRASGSR